MNNLTRSDKYMPKNLDFVFSAYSIWIVAFLIYIPMIKYKLNKYSKEIKAFGQKK